MIVLTKDILTQTFAHKYVNFRPTENQMLLQGDFESVECKHIFLRMAIAIVIKGIEYYSSTIVVSAQGFKRITFKGDQVTKYTRPCGQFIILFFRKR